jgi:hypothetical protein
MNKQSVWIKLKTLNITGIQYTLCGIGSNFKKNYKENSWVYI